MILYLVNIFSFVFFYIVDQVLIVVGEPHVLTEKHVSFHIYRNIVISFVHSSLTSVGVIICFFLDPHIFEDYMSSSNLFTQSVLVFSGGYFLHDSFHLCQGKISRATFELLLHHFTSLCCVYSLIYYQTLIAFGIISLSLEINSVFMHGRKILRFRNVPVQSNLVKGITVANLISFVLLRLILFDALMFYLMKNLYRLPLVMKVISVWLLFGFALLNHILFYRLVKSDIRIYASSASACSKHKERGAINNGDHKNVEEKLN